MSKSDTIAEESIYFIPRNQIHPDPDQPRVHPDADLQESIDANGVIQAISVRPHPELADEWMIVDGERRWRGAAHLAEIPCRLRLDLEDPADRIIAQMSANTGKPLTPIEEAFAIAKLVEVGFVSDTELAKRLGMPRSTIGDRRRMLHLAPCWIDLLKAGKLQASHTPVLHTYLAVPEKYQVEAAQRFVADPRVRHFFDVGEPVPIEEFKRLVWEYFEKHVRALSKEVHPSWPDDAEKYEGPVVELTAWYGGRKTRYAADPDIWRPILRRASAARASKTREKSKRSGGREKQPAHLQLPAGTKTIKPAAYSYEPPKGFAEVVDSYGNWNVDGHRARRAGGVFDIDVFVQHVDPEKLAVFKAEHSNPSVVTNDTAAMGLARSAWIDRWSNRRVELIAELRDMLHKTVSVSDPARTAPRYQIDGRGVTFLVAKLASMTDASPDLLEIAEALNIEGAAQVKDKDSTKWLSKLPVELARPIASGFAFVTDNQIDAVWRRIDKEAEKAVAGYRKRQVKWDAIGKTVSPTIDKEVPIAAAVDVGAMRAAVEADVAEGELEEATA